MYKSLLFLLFLCLLSLVGCKQDSRRPGEAILATIQSGETRFHYKSTDDSSNGRIEQQENRCLYLEKGQIYYFELYNDFLHPDGHKQFTILEMIFHPDSILQRFPIREIDVDAQARIENPDAGSIFAGEIKEVRQLDFEGKKIPVFQILGYAHTKDPEASHHKFWNPELGTILIWYGERRYFELIKAPGWTESSLLAFTIAIKEAFRLPMP